MSTLIGLCVILLIAAFASLAKVLKRRWEPEASAAPLLAMREPRAPFGLFIDRAHSWVRLMSDGTLRIGLDDFLAEGIGRVDGIDMPAPGTQVARGETLVTLRVGDRRIAIPSPVDGEIAGHNETAQQSPVTVTSDPYGLGWLLSVRTLDHKEAIKPLHVGNGALGFLRQEMSRLADFFTARASTAPVMADGGVPQRGALADLDESGLDAFEEQFLKQD